MKFKPGHQITNLHNETYDVLDDGVTIRSTGPSKAEYHFDAVLDLDASGPWYLKGDGVTLYIPNPVEHRIIELLQDKEGNFVPKSISSADIVDALSGAVESYQQILEMTKPETITLTREEFEAVLRYDPERSSYYEDADMNKYIKYFKGV